MRAASLDELSSVLPPVRGIKWQRSEEFQQDILINFVVVLVIIVAERNGIFGTRRVRSVDVVGWLVHLSPGTFIWFSFRPFSINII